MNNEIVFYTLEMPVATTTGFEFIGYFCSIEEIKKELKSNGWVKIPRHEITSRPHNVHYHMYDYYKSNELCYCRVIEVTITMMYKGPETVSKSSFRDYIRETHKQVDVE